MIGGGAADHDGSDSGRTQAAFQIGSYEGAVDALDDDGLTGALARLILDAIAATAGQERRGRPGAFVADMEDRRAAVAERSEEIRYPLDRIRIVAPLASGLLFVKGVLHVDNDESGSGLRVGHGWGFRT